MQEQSSKWYATKLVVVRTWSILILLLKNAQPTEKLKHAVAINVGITGRVEQYKMAFYNVHKFSMLMKLASNNVFWQSKVHLHSHKDYV